jgi:thioesterase domain-containing protein/acyl carrier protein
VSNQKAQLDNGTKPGFLAPNGQAGSGDNYLFPCSMVQRVCWFLEQMSPGTAAYNIAVRFLLSGPLDAAVLEEALRRVVFRHEILRTRFVEMDGEPKQMVEPGAHFPLRVVDLRALAPTERAAESERLAAEEANAGFDLGQGPLFRGQLIQSEDQQFTLLLTMHHIISDGWSVGIITDEMGGIYESLVEGAGAPLPELSIQYGDYACWQQEWNASGELDRQLVEVRSRLDGFQPLDIPTDFPRPQTPGNQGEIRSILLPRQLTDSLREASEQRGCTMFVTMLSAFLVLLHLQSKQTELTVRTQTAGRDRTELESLIGWFVNSIVLRVDASGNPTFEDLLERVRQVVLDGFEYQQFPFERLMGVIRPARTPSRHPPFQVNFIFQRDFVHPWKRANVSLKPIPSKATGTFVDLNFFLVEREDGWRASVDVNTDVFRAETGEYFLECYRRILAACVRQPASRIASMALPPRPHQPVQAEHSETFSLDNYVPPRNEHEEAIVEIWKQVLGTTEIGAYSNFFDLGGHSLKAVSLLAEIKRKFGKEIKVSELFVDPTPAAMAQVISGAVTYSDGRDLIPVQPQGTRPPFFLVGGDHYFRPLAKAMGLDQPFVGVPLLKYRHLDIGKTRLAIAQELAQLLISQHSGGPFLLGGWCADGLTAYEVGRALIQAGETVSLVVLFDAMNPDYYRNTRSLVNSVGRTMTSIRSILKPASSGSLIARISGASTAMGTLVRRLGRRIADTYKGDYRSAPVSFPVLVVRPPASSALEKHDLGWSQACGGSLTVMEVPGDHSSIFREPNIGVVGWKLRQQLDVALARVQPSRRADQRGDSRVQTYSIKDMKEHD